MNNCEKIILGIDLGTTNSCACIWRNNTYEIIPDEFGNKTIPSFVSYTHFSKYVGLEAKKQKEINISNVFYETKRLIGRKYNDENVEKIKELLSYDIIENERGCISLKTCNDLLITPEEISANILMKLKQNANNYLKTQIKDVVITVPAHFNENQRQATQDACKIAGLNCVRMLHEPTAGALAYGLIERTLECQKVILVYDFGGGTLDVSLIDVFNGCFEVMGSSGISHFGGVDFDNKLINLCIAKFSRQHNIKLNLKEINKVNLQKLRILCENAKKILSIDISTIIYLENFHENKNLNLKLSRTDFENICRDLFLLCLSPVDDLLNECEKLESDIDEVIMIGGMTRIPYIRELLRNKFNNSKTNLNFNIDPDIAVAIGASIQGYIICNKDDVFSDSVTLLDVAPLSLGVEVIGGVMDVLIKRNTLIPCEKTKLYTTDSDNMESVIIKIFEGERAMTEYNFKIGEFELNKIPQQLKGVPEIEITFELNINGMVIVKATEKEGGESKSIVINTNTNGLTKEQLDKLIEEALLQETTDEITRMKKYNFYEIFDMCENILININLKENNLTQENIKNIKNDIDIIQDFLKEKNYDKREIEEYDEIIKKIKTKYGVLILQNKKNNDKVKEFTDNVNATTLYGKDDDEEEKELNNSYTSINNIDEEENNDEIKELRKELKELCENINEILSKDLNIEKKYLQELTHYIDDVMMWYYSVEKPSKEDYITKINFVNSVCNELIENNTNLFNVEIKNKSLFEELEELCMKILTLIQNKQMSGNKAKINLLSYFINNEVLNYLYIDENKNDTITKNYIDKINKKYNDIYNDITNIYKKEDIIIKKKEGMSIKDLLKLKQEEEINDIIDRD